MTDDSEYRLPTKEEQGAMDPLTPRILEKKVFVSCPNGVSNEMTIRYADGSVMRNVIRVLISMEQDESVKVHLTRFNNETGRMEFEQAECLVGGD